MPYVDKYGTQSPICLIRQIIDYKIFYNRELLEEQFILVDCMFAACMNPKSGSFVIDLRLQRHFTVFSCLTADKDLLYSIYHQILNSHLQLFDPQCAAVCIKIINATQDIFTQMATNPTLMPTATKFHYQFNMRDFAKIIQNCMQAQPQYYRNMPINLVRLWVHECNRVYYDRLILPEDRDLYRAFLKNALKHFDQKEEEIMAEPLIYTSFVSKCEGHDDVYTPIRDMAQLKTVLEKKLEEYNEQIAKMNLVLFDQAMEHISRIARIINLPVGNALLVGVGGSGKQSLSKLTSFILEYDVVRILVSSNYGMFDLKTDLQTFYRKAGQAGAELLFILTDSQIAQDMFLVYINDMLSSGYIPELFAKDEVEEIVSKVRAEAKGNGVPDIPDAIFEYFKDKARKNLHIALCFSPVGDAFRYRARKFPGLISSTSIDWFHEWPRDALIGVAARFLEELDLPSEEIRENIALHMAGVHISIGEANKEFFMMERRYNYTTPTSFLELISFYKNLLESKQSRIVDSMQRLEKGLGTMETTTEQVAKLQEQLEIKMVEVEAEKKATNELIDIVSHETEIAQKE